MRDTRHLALKPIVAALLAWGCWGTAMAEPQAIDIPALPAQQAIDRLAAQTKLRIQVAPDALRGVTTRPVTGTLEPRAALEQMLEGSGLRLVDAADGGVTLQRAAGTAAAGAETLPMVNITTTARRWNERMLDTPIAMTVQTGEALRQAGIADVSTALTQVPGVTSLNAGTTVAISIRGISTDIGGNASGYYLDDLPFTGVTTSFAPDTRSWDLERIEVLKGPQGTLFGEGSMGGTVRITTNNARLGEFGFAGQVGLAGVADGGTSKSAKVMLNVPLSDTFALRFAGTSEKEAGWIDDTVTGKKDVNEHKINTGRIRAHWEPTDRLSLNASYWKYDADLGKGNIADDNGNLPLSVGSDIGQKWDVTGFSASYDFDAVNLFYGFARNSFRTTLTGPLLGGTSKISVDIKPVTSHELRATSNGNGPLKWTVGLYKRDADRSDSLVLDSPVISLNNVSNTESRAEAVFGEGSYTLPNVPVELTVGLRHFRDKQKNEDITPGVPSVSSEATFKSTSPRFSLAFKPQRDTLYFATASKGFRSGIFQPQPAIAIGDLLGIDLPASIPPDSVWTYELGTKQTFLEGRMAFEASIYHSDWKDRPVRFPLGTTGINGLMSSDGSKTNGIEASLAWEASKTLMLTMAATYISAKWTDDVPGTSIVKGDQVDEVPKFQVNAAANWRLPEVSGWNPLARLAINHSSKRESHAQALSTPGDAITRVDGRIALERGPWVLTAYVDNIFDERGAVSSRTVQPLGPGVTDIYATRLPPRTIGVELRYAIGR